MLQAKQDKIKAVFSRTWRLKRRPAPREAKTASAMVRGSGSTDFLNFFVPVSSLTHFRQSHRALMLAHITPHAKSASVFSSRQSVPHSHGLTARRALPRPKSQICKVQHQTRKSASQSSSSRKLCYYSARYFSTSSQNQAKSKKVLEEAPETIYEEEFDAFFQTPADLPLHCVFKVLAVETPPNYFVPVRIPWFLHDCDKKMCSDTPTQITLFFGLQRNSGKRNLARTALEVDLSSIRPMVSNF